MTLDEKIVEAAACAIFHAKPRNRIWDALPNEFKNQYRKQARAAITAYQAEAWQEPSDGLLMSMAIRYDHGLGMPGHYEQSMLGGKPGDHERRLRATIRTMRKLYEEATGAGFYKPDREDSYRAMMERCLALPNPPASP